MKKRKTTPYFSFTSIFSHTKKGLVLAVVLFLPGAALTVGYGKAAYAGEVPVEEDLRIGNIQAEKIALTPEESGADSDPYKVKTFEVSGSALLNVSTPKGNIEIVSSPETENVKVELYVDRGFALWSSSSNLDNYLINLFQRGNEIIASVEKKGKSSSWSDGVSFNIKIHAPREVSSELKTMGGHISIEGARGSQKIRSSGGHLKLHDLRGEVKAYTSGGHIELNDLSGSVLAYTQGGSISAEKLKGEMRLKTNAGNISGENLKGYMAASTSAGNIDVEMSQMERGLSLEAKAGNVSARVPGNTGYNVNLSGTTADMDFNGQFNGERSGNLIQGVINDGGININMTSKFGKTSLRLD